MFKLVLIRHGQSQWNLENRFTGWTDVDLTEKGIEEARHAGVLLREKGYSFDVVLTSVLKRAIKTAWHVLDEMDLCHIPVERHWRLNERHYGALQGQNKKEKAEEVGDEQVHIWRRSFDVPPPSLTNDDPRHPSHDPRYGLLTKAQLPSHESLEDTINRVLPYWELVVTPLIKDSKKVLIAAHGNSLRGIVKHLDKISSEEIPNVEIPTGKPLVYELDEDLVPTKKFYLDQV